MSVAGDLVLAAFFDEPGLLAARLQRAGGAPRGRARIAAFATRRAPDTATGIGCGALGCGSVAGVAGIGVALVLVGGAAMRGCVARVGSGHVDAAAEARIDDEPAWAQALDTLGEDLAPARADLRPWHVRTLLDVPRELHRRGRRLAGWISPIGDQPTERRARRLAQLLAGAGAGRDLAIIVDLPGPAAVAAAAGLADSFDPVFTMDNLPHPAGVVDSTATLAAMAHWLPQLRAARGKRDAEAPAAFVLEGGRLAAYANEVDRFDNRSRARLPEVGGLRRLGVDKVLYVRAQRGRVAAAADLVAGFAALRAAGIAVRHIALETMDDPALADGEAARRWIWREYGWWRPPRLVFPEATDPDAAHVDAVAEAAPPPEAAALDGGAARRAQVLDALAPDEQAPSSAPIPLRTSTYRPLPFRSTWRPSSRPGSTGFDDDRRSGGWGGSSSGTRTARPTSSGGSWGRSFGSSSS